MGSREIKIGCAILAGGKNRRMGGVDKAFINVEGVPIIERVLAVVRPVCEEVFVVSNRPESYAGYRDFQVIPDIIPGKGPLGGLYTALRHTSGYAILLLACDMPYITSSLIGSLTRTYLRDPGKALVPRHNPRLQPPGSHLAEPLCAAYPATLLPVMETIFRQGDDLSMIGFLRHIEVNWFDIPDDDQTLRAFLNLNRK